MNFHTGVESPGAYVDDWVLQQAFDNNGYPNYLFEKIFNRYLTNIIGITPHLNPYHPLPGLDGFPASLSQAPSSHPNMEISNEEQSDNTIILL